MLNVSVQKEALKTLTGKDLCWVFVLTDKAAKAFLNTELLQKACVPSREWSGGSCFCLFILYIIMHHPYVFKMYF